MAGPDRQQQLPQPQRVPHAINHQIPIPSLRLKHSSKLHKEQSSQPVPRQPISTTSGRDSSSLVTRKSSLPKVTPKPMSVISSSPMLTPVTTLRSRTSPPTKSYPVFGSSLPPEKRRNVIRRKQSSTSSSFSLVSLRTSSTNSLNASTISLTTTSQSSAPSGSRSTSQQSILGITMPSTSSSSSRFSKKRTASSSSNEIPRAQTRDIPLSPPPSISELGPSSSPSTRYTDSPGPFSYSSASSVASQSPSFGPVGYRSRQNPAPCPTRTHNLDSVRESTTSTSSGSTIRASKDKDGEDQDYENIGPWTDSPIPMNSPPVSEGSGYFGYPLTVTSAPTTPFYRLPSQKSPKPTSGPTSSPSLLSTPSPALGSSRRKVSVSSATTFSRLGSRTPDLLSTNNAPKGLGVSIPTTASLAKGRSKSLSGSTAFSLPQRSGRKETVTPPIPSPSFPPPQKNSAPIVRGATPAPRDPMSIQTGLGPRVMSSRGDSKGVVVPVSVRDRSPTRASPGKPSKPGFFSRQRTRTNESMEERMKEKENKEKRKGPAAGTGHEAYSAFSNRGRSGSATSTGSIDRSGSASSTTGSWGRTSRRGSESKEPTDDYLRERLLPVVIAGGGGVIENYNLAGPGEAMMRTGSQESSKEKKSFEFGKRALTPVTMSREPSSEGSIFSRRKISTPNPPSPGSLDAPIQTKKKGAWGFLRGTASTRERQGTPVPQAIPTPVPAIGAQTTKFHVQHTRTQPHYLANFDREQQREAAKIAEQMQELRSKKASNNYSSTLRQKHNIHSVKPSIAPAVSPASLSNTPAPAPTMVKASVPATALPMPPVSAPAPASTGEQAKREVRQAKADERQRLQHQRRIPQIGRIPAVQYHTRKGSQQNNEVKQIAPALVVPALVPAPAQAPEAQAPTPAQAPAQAPGPAPAQAPGPGPGPAPAPGPGPAPAPAPARAAAPSTRMRVEMLPPLNTHYPRGDVRNTDLLTAPPTMGRPFEESFKRANEQNAAGFQVNWSGFGLVQTPVTALPTRGNRKPFSFDQLDVAPIQNHRASVTLTPIDDTPVASTTNMPWNTREGSAQAPTLAHNVVDEGEYGEDIWNEYDDLLYDVELFGEPAGDVEFQGKTRSTTSSLGSPFQYADLCTSFPDLSDGGTEGPPNTPEPVEGIDQGLYLHDSPTLSPALPTVIVAAPDPVMDSGQPFIPPSYPAILSPSTPFSVSSFIRSYGDRDSYSSIAALPNTNHPPTSSPPAPPAPAITLDAPPPPKQRIKTHKAKGSNGSSGSNLSTGSENFIDSSEDEMKVRLWALMTNRWLSFDRTLLSPAHEQMNGITAPVGPRASGGGRILVVDGLGTDDWSFYCAFSYPKAKIYNLSSSPSASPNGQPPSPSTPRPPNHQQIHHSNFSEMFPFPGGFFNVISFRFLPSSLGSELPFILSECKRVLEPGGYLEVTMLDPELINMGTRTKKAVNLVKAIMERESSSPSPSERKPSSERVLKILQKRGFDDINKCYISLPTVAPSEDFTVSTVPTPSTPTATQPISQEPEVIDATVMSTVGRWWYTRCYERVITAEGEVMRRSMWNDRALLRECGVRKTTFRMLVAHARKPLKAPAAIVG